MHGLAAGQVSLGQVLRCWPPHPLHLRSKLASPGVPLNHHCHPPVVRPECSTGECRAGRSWQQATMKASPLLALIQAPSVSWFLSL